MSIDDFRSIPYSRYQLADGRTGALRTHQVHGGASHHRQDRHNEYEYAHTADPVSEAAPEQAGIAECFHVGQDTGTCGSKAGDRLEESINIKRDLSGENEGNRTVLCA